MRLSIAVLALLLVGVLHASGASADDAALTAEIRARVNELNQAFADRDTAKIETMITADQIAVIPVYGSRPVSRSGCPRSTNTTWSNRRSHRQK